MQYLIGYDIADPKRLQRIHRRMTKYATPIQYSIFLFEGSEKLLTECLTEKMISEFTPYPITAPNGA